MRYLVTYLIEANEKITFLTLIENLSEDDFEKSNEIFDRLMELKKRLNTNSVAIHYMKEL